MGVFQSLGRSVVAGLALLALALVAVGLLSGQPVRFDATWLRFAARWLHVAAGVMWLGLLWYFNFVQIPVTPTLPEELKPAVVRFIAPRALFWFRWSAAATVVTGLAVAHASGYLAAALMLAPGAQPIGIGMWLALIMAFNAWFILWPAQKRALGLVPADAPERARAARRAMVTSRVNLVLSIPMLYGMVAQSHGGF